MNPQLAAIAGELESAQRRLHALRDRLSPAEWNRRPGENRWSPLECVVHLNLTSEAFLPLLRAGIDKARREGRTAPRRYRHSIFGWLIARGLSKPGQFKSRTTPDFVPTNDRPASEVLADFDVLQQQILGCVRDSDGIGIHRVSVRSPFNRRLKYSVYSALSILPTHQHRHLWQAGG